MSSVLRVATYNIHKGFSFFRRRLVIHAVRESLRQLGADIVFLQEVHGRHERHASRYLDWPVAPQYEFLADSVWRDYAYGRNSVYDAGHHGNAILSRYPILRWDNQDVSTHRLEKRGLLHCEIQPPGWAEPLHCVCVHLGLLSRGRGRQLELLRQRIERLVPPAAPLIVAGDFNDWRYRAAHELAHPQPVRGVRAGERRARAKLPGGPASDVARPDLPARLPGSARARTPRTRVGPHFRPRRARGNAGAFLRVGR